ncbi:unnamed protein product, partial [Adineta ricciae]
STSPELQIPYQPIKPHKLRARSKSVSPTSHDSSSIIIGAPTNHHYHSRNRHKTVQSFNVTVDVHHNDENRPSPNRTIINRKNQEQTKRNHRANPRTTPTRKSDLKYDNQIRKSPT